MDGGEYAKILYDIVLHVTTPPFSIQKKCKPWCGWSPKSPESMARDSWIHYFFPHEQSNNKNTSFSSQKWSEYNKPVIYTSHKPLQHQFQKKNRQIQFKERSFDLFGAHFVAARTCQVSKKTFHRIT